MNRNLRYFFILNAFIIVAASVGAIHSQTISGSIGGGAVSRGSTARGVIAMSIPAGLHVNSNRPSSRYAIATTVRISGSGVRIGSVSFPRGRDRKFQFSENTINVYEGIVRFPFTVSVPASFAGKSVKVRAVIRYQACTNEVCYPPKNKEITVMARVR